MPPPSANAFALLGLAVAAVFSTVSAGTVSVPFVRRAHEIPPPSLSRRGDGSSIGLEALNNITGGGYYADFSVGTPPQKLSFLLDTGSSDTWVNSVAADLCTDKDRQQQQQLWCQTQCALLLELLYHLRTLLTLSVLPVNPNASSTFKTVDKGAFNITYLDRRNIQGDYVNDTLTIHGKQIKNQQLGLALRSVRPTGIMGLGYSANVASNKTYPTVVDNMVAQGVIDTAVFSLYLVRLPPFSL